MQNGIKLRTLFSSPNVLVYHIAFSQTNFSWVPTTITIDHFKLSDSNIMKRKRKPSVIDHKKHAAGTHDQMYADMFLYLPWDNAEEFLGEARRSEEVCKAMWGVYGGAVKELKEKLRRRIREARLS